MLLTVCLKYSRSYNKCSLTKIKDHPTKLPRVLNIKQFNQVLVPIKKKKLFVDTEVADTNT